MTQNSTLYGYRKWSGAVCFPDYSKAKSTTGKLKIVCIFDPFTSLFLSILYYFNSLKLYYTLIDFEEVDKSNYQIKTVIFSEIKG